MWDYTIKEEFLGDTMIFTDGAFLQPVNINNKWYWMVVGFKDDSYLDGEVCDPVVTAESQDELLREDEDMEV